MAIASVGAADLGNNGGSGTLTSSAFTVGAGSNLLVVGAKGDASSDNILTAVWDLTGANQLMTLIGKKNPGNRWVYLWALPNPATGNKAVTITTLGGYILAGAADYSGYDTTASPIYDSTATYQATNNTHTVSTTVVAANCWLVLVGGTYTDNSPPTAGSGTTRRTFDGNFGTYGLFDSNGTVGTGSQSLTFLTNGLADTNAVIMSIAPSTGGGGATVKPLAALGVG